MYLSGITTSWINNAFERLLAEQKARVGRFLTYDRLLRDLKNRAESIRKVDSSRGLSLLERVKSSQERQKALETDAMQMLATVNNLKTNAVTKIMTDSRMDIDDFSNEIQKRAYDIFSNLKILLSQSGNLNSDISDHESTVAQLEKDIRSAEGDFANRGIIRKTAGFVSKPIEKFATYAGIGIAGALIITQVLKKGKS